MKALPRASGTRDLDTDIVFGWFPIGSLLPQYDPAETAGKLTYAWPVSSVWVKLRDHHWVRADGAFYSSVVYPEAAAVFGRMFGGNLTVGLFRVPRFDPARVNPAMA